MAEIDLTETVTIEDEFGSKREIPRGAVPYFVNQGAVVLDSAGRVNSKATAAATSTSKEN